ncbi:MAG: hypothetical protein E5V26_00580 [Mesorhizobium sp.]|nr:MAG: hypothetical protein E5V26_00580 [Mesorhizobium sp.]
MTFLAALRHDRVDAAWLIDGPINGERFRLRKAARRTADAVCSAIGQILDTVTSKECAHYFTEAGMLQPKIIAL